MDGGRFLDVLVSRRTGGGQVAAWSLCLSETRRLTLGIKDRQTGNVHAPASLCHGGGASYLLVWEDGSISRGFLERAQLEASPGETLAEARAAAYRDADAARVLGPAEFPQVRLHESAVEAIVEGDLELPTRRLDALRDRVEREGFRTWSGSFTASSGRSRVVTSAGLEIAARGTTFSWHFMLDGEVGDGFAARRPDSELEFQERLERLVLTARQLRVPASPMKPGVRRVLLHPGVVERYVWTTLMGNLSGAAVAHGESRFRPDQFGATEPLFREDFGLAVDPRQPLKLGSYRFTSEGLAADHCEFISRGCLVQPMLDLKYARRLSRKPTPRPSAADVMLWAGPPARSLEQTLPSAPGSALVLSVLGAHTQDAASGDFSLAAPQTLRLGSRGPEGRLRATLSGNLFDLLRSESLQFVRFPGEPTPGLLIECRLDPR